MATEKDAITIMQEFVGRKNIRLTERGNFAIFAALHMAKRINLNKSTILVPDQGGWISFETYPKLLGLRIEKVKTDYGLIDFADLKEKLRLQSVCAIITTSLAGYYAEQDMMQVYELCRAHGCLVIEDASGIVSKKVYGDIVVGSFGHWKPVNLGYGGFIATNRDFGVVEDIFSMSKTNFDYSKLVKQLKNTKKHIEKLEKRCADVKKDLKDFNILHKDHKGLNVVVKFSGDEEKKKIIDYCDKKKLEFVVCPKNIRVLEDAVSIEVKRLD